MTTITEVMYGGTKGQPEPEVGMGVTFLWYSDTTPGTIVDVVPFKSGPNKGKARLIRIQEDEYVYETGEIVPNPDARIVTATRRKYDAFRTVKEKAIFDVFPENIRVRVGDRRYYRDPSF